MLFFFSSSFRERLDADTDGTSISTLPADKRLREPSQFTLTTIFHPLFPLKRYSQGSLAPSVSELDPLPPLPPLPPSSNFKALYLLLFIFRFFFLNSLNNGHNIPGESIHAEMPSFERFQSPNNSRNNCRNNCRLFRAQD